MPAEVVVVGAGLSGLVAAGRLAEDGVGAFVVERARRPGGRLATERLGPATFDHGAQFFTVRDDRFAALTDAWRGEGLPMRVWCHGFARAESVRCGPDAAQTQGDGHPRYTVAGGMRRLAEHLARGLDLDTATGARAVARVGRRWSVELDTGRQVDAEAVVCTPPVPETLQLLEAGGVVLPAGLGSALSALTYEPCLAVLVALDGPARLPSPGGVQFSGGPLRFMADNAAKGLSAVPALTLHAAGEWSAAHADDADEAVAGALLDAAAPWLGDAGVRHAEVRRWRYSRPLQPVPDRAVAVDGLVLAGDAYGGPRVEGAALSGLAAAERVLDALSTGGRRA